MPLFNPSDDLNAIQKILINDEMILSLMDLTGKASKEKAERIIKRSQWSDLADSDKRLGIFFIPSRPTRNESFFKEAIQINCHVPAIQDHVAYKIQDRIKKILDEKKINNRYIYFNGQLGELPTMPGLFSCGSRYTFNRKV